ncbi:extracellular solute-binding protein [Allorhizocola rhizosphaerae]|uniref:extracellular solute-binding protein n=1 Tax=Allorhizocola rhizosphaerae TaxID=1872709 RepID=UPI000E3BCD9B|nr:extracellular solute-binding protein [Allorhizocola rhizosphaerae]
MKPFNKIGALLGAVAITLPLTLASCGKSEEKADPADLGTLTIMLPLIGGSGTAPAPDGEIHKAVEAFTGKKLEITWIPNANYGDRMNVTLASDNLPEVMVSQGKLPAFVQSAEAGAFWDLTNKLDSYPNLKAANKQIERNSSINGKVYGVFRGRDPMRAAVIVREDWLTKLGLKMPETVDDLYNVAKAFTENDPDGNGKKDTYGLIIPKWPAGYGSASPYDVVETWFGAPNGWGERNGKLVPGFDTEEFLAANRYMKKMITEGLVNPDYATFDSGKWEQPFFQGKGGIIVDVSSRGPSLLKLFKEKDAANYDSYVDLTGNLKGPDGKLRAFPTTGYNGFLAISKQSVPTEAELDDVLNVLNKLSSKEGQILLNNGIEGRNFTVQDGFAIGKPQDDPAVKTMTSDVSYFGQLGTATAGYQAYVGLPPGKAERAMYEKRLKFHKADEASAVHNPAQMIISKTQVAKGAQLDLIVSDARIKYFAGQIDEAGLKAEIKRWYDQGGQDIVNEMNEQYAKIKK